MNAVAKIQSSGIPALAMNEQELIDVLRTSLYPGAADNSIRMVIGYCKAAALDPMQKPVHIVPMWDGKAKAMRDVIMPGVGLYRTQAARSGQLAGVSEPEFGADKTEKLGGVEITYPEWCKVTVRRELASGKIVDFTAIERWKENYAVKGGQEKSIAPNAMWFKRPYAQLAKCAQAQAFRIGFPEAGAAPTADEMEGKAFDEYTQVEPEKHPLTPKLSGVSITASLFEELTEAQQNKLTDIAMVVVEHLAAGFITDALKVIDEASLDNDEKAALPSRFSKDQRAVLKRERQIASLRGAVEKTAEPNRGFDDTSDDVPQ